MTFISQTIGKATFYAGARWSVAQGDLKKQAKRTTVSLGMTNTDLVAWWCNSATGRYNGGEGFIGSACFPYNGYHITLNEIQRTKAQSGFVS